MRRQSGTSIYQKCYSYYHLFAYRGGYHQQTSPLNGYPYPTTQDLNYSMKPEPSYMPTTTTTTVGYDMRIKTEVHSVQPDNGIQILEIG